MTPYSPTASFFDITLPMLPGAIGPAASTAVMRVDVSPSTDTVTFSRIEFADVIEDEVAIEDMRTMIVDRPGSPYEGWTKARLYRRAQELDLPRRSTLTKAQLRKALIAFEGR